MAFEVTGRITEKDVDAVFEPLQSVMKGHAKVNVLAMFMRWDGFDPALLLDGSTMASKFGLIGHLKRYAIVGAPSWIRSLVSAMGPVMPFEMRFFDKNDEASAREWVGLT